MTQYFSDFFGASMMPVMIQQVWKQGKRYPFRITVVLPTYEPAPSFAGFLQHLEGENRDVFLNRGWWGRSGCNRLS